MNINKKFDGFPLMQKILMALAGTAANAKLARKGVENIVFNDGEVTDDLIKQLERLSKLSSLLPEILEKIREMKK